MTTMAYKTDEIIAMSRLKEIIWVLLAEQKPNASKSLNVCKFEIRKFWTDKKELL
jgi:hypothetical protein